MHRPRWRDSRVWFGVAVTLVFLWLALRGVNFAELGRALAGANWLLLMGVSVPVYAVLLWFRALRWRLLTNPIQSIETGSLFRAVSVGFLANNVFPLRMGEVVRSWYLARETGASAAALFGTVILERVIDTVSVIMMALLVLAFWGGGGDGVLERGALLLVPVAALPILFLVLLRKRPERVIGLTVGALRPLPERVPVFVERHLRHFSKGLGALTRGSHLIWIGVYSALIWLVLSAIPIIAAFYALEMDLGSPLQVLGAAWMTQAAIGAAVALPSAPGFFGIFHAACRFALVRFGVDSETAVAAGTLIHAAMWITLTAFGLAVLRLRRTSLGEVEEAVDEASDSSPR